MFLELDDVVDEDVRLQSRGSKVCPFLPFHHNSQNSSRVQEVHFFWCSVCDFEVPLQNIKLAARNEQNCLDGAKDASQPDFIALVVFPKDDY